MFLKPFLEDESLYRVTSSIDATKFSSNLEMCYSQECIVGGTFPHHKIPTEDIFKEELKNITTGKHRLVMLKNDDGTLQTLNIEKATEIKLCTLSLQ